MVSSKKGKDNNGCIDGERLEILGNFGGEMGEEVGKSSTKTASFIPWKQKPPPLRK